MNRFKTLLIALYNSKGLGVRYLSSVLKQRGYPCSLLFLKGYQPYDMRKPSEVEYALVDKVIEREKPDLIGISYMCTFHREVMVELTQRLRRQGHRVVWGGAATTLFPEEALEYVDLAVRGEAEEAFPELVEALANDKDYTGIPNVAFKRDGQKVINDIRPLNRDLDSIPFPDLGGDDKYWISNGNLEARDPELDGMGYEIMASRGCPFRCSYCSNDVIRRIHAGKGPYVRRRSVDSVMRELLMAKEKMPRLKMVHFWDDIFPTNLEWVREFASRYKREIGLPFEIWHHPLLVKEELIRPLVDAGLSKIVVGIQSGSPYTRNQIFLRPESQEQIIACSKVLSDAGVPTIIYDLILDNPFETEENLAETLDLCLKLHRPFYLQLHGLNFLPGTKIEEMALERGLITREKMKELQLRPINDQYRAMYWWVHGTGVKQDPVQTYWNSLIYFTQFSMAVPFVKWARKSRFLKSHPGVLQGLLRLTNLALIARKAWRKVKIALGARA